MVSATTHDIEVQVDVKYQPQYSVPFSAEYLFAYHIRITNHSSEAIQLLGRRWYITDGAVLHREVSGEGLVGQQPHLAPGHTHEYVSYCNLRHPYGCMYGQYEGIRKLSGELFEIQVPRFTMLIPPLLS
ncbi:MAG: Co2+/Mg2+ efflux protein ApaG [Bacteroidia bacterium]